jgi:hypothetical protein
MMPDLGMVFSRCLESLQGVDSLARRLSGHAMQEPRLVEIRREQRSFPCGNGFLDRQSVSCSDKDVKAGSGKYNSQVGIKRILIFRSHDLVQIIGCGILGGDVVAGLEDRYVRIPVLSEMQGGRDAEGPGADDDNWVRLGNAHGGLGIWK